MALTIEEQHETNDLDHDILATREVTFICGHKRVYEDISACQKSWMERCQRCPNCQYKRDKAYVEKLSAEINSPELLEMWLKETPPTKTSKERRPKRGLTSIVTMKARSCSREARRSRTRNCMSTTAMTSIAACPCPVVPVNGCNRSPTFN